jgi:flagellar biogenesis protein FliO
MNNLMIAILAFFINFSIFAADVKIESLRYNDSGDGGILTINLSKELREDPELFIKDKIIQVSIPGSFVWPKIEKNISVVKEFDSKMMAYQFDKGSVRVRTKLPYNIKSKEDEVSLTIKGKRILVHFPTMGNKRRNVAFVPTRRKKVEPSYDESYLEKLLKDKDDVKAKIQEDKIIVEKKIIKKDIAKDSVSLTMSGAEKSKKANVEPFSMTNYVGKFVGFLALVLLFFYGVMTLLRKGVMKKGRLGFLNSTQIVEVLGTTHIAPKKSLLLIKAHNQVFLVSNTDAGMSLISEVNDVNGLMKDGEKQVSGSNFDSQLDVASLAEKTFNTKEKIDLSSELQNLDKEAVTDKVKFSDQIKNKVKSLKSLQ